MLELCRQAPLVSRLVALLRVDVDEPGVPAPDRTVRPHDLPGEQLPHEGRRKAGPGHFILGHQQQRHQQHPQVRAAGLGAGLRAALHKAEHLLPGAGKHLVSAGLQNHREQQVVQVAEDLQRGITHHVGDGGRGAAIRGGGTRADGPPDHLDGGSLDQHRDRHQDVVGAAAASRLPEHLPQAGREQRQRSALVRGVERQG